MRIIDEQGIELQEQDIDYSQGYIEEEEILVAHHEAIEAVEEQGHWETEAEYPNGGKDVAWVVDVPGVKAKDAWDEYETVLRFKHYSAQEIAEQEIEQLKAQLKETDYIVIKIAEGVATWEEYPEMKEKRQVWRDEINRLENEAGV